MEKHGPAKNGMISYGRRSVLKKIKGRIKAKGGEWMGRVGFKILQVPAVANAYLAWYEWKNRVQNNAKK